MRTPRPRAPRAQRLFTVAGLVVATLAIGGSAALARSNSPTVPHVVIGLPKTEVPLWDSIYNGIAKAYDSAGYVSSAVISWSAEPPGIVSILQSFSGHSATVAGIREGIALVRASWNGMSDTTLVYVTKARVIRVRAYKNFKVINGVVTGVMDTIHVGDVSCVYVHDVDRRGGVVTGKAFTLKSSNANIVRVGTGDTLRSPACPDTTIDPVKMAILLGVPGAAPSDSR